MYGNNQRLTPSQYFDKYKTDWYDAQRLLINGQPALYKVSIAQRVPGEKEKQIYLPQYLILYKNKALFEILYACNNYDVAKNNEKLYNQIVSTMEFFD